MRMFMIGVILLIIAIVFLVLPAQRNRKDRRTWELSVVVLVAFVGINMLFGMFKFLAIIVLGLAVGYNLLGKLKK